MAINPPATSDDQLPRVLVAGLNAEYGGGAVAIGRAVSKGLARRGYDVCLLEPHGELHESGARSSIQSGSSDGYELLTVNYWPVRLHAVSDHISFQRGNVLLDEVLDRVKPDIVHFQHTITYGADSLRIAKERGCCVLITLHDFWMFCALIQRINLQGSVCSGPGDGRRCRLCAKQYAGDDSDWVKRRNAHIELLNTVPDVILAESNDVRNYAIGQGVLPERIVVQNPSVDSIDRIWHDAKFCPRPLEFQRLTVAFIGTMQEHKGIHLLLEAVALLKEKWQRRVCVALYGNAEPQYLKSLHTLARQINFADVKFYGAYDANRDLLNIFAKTDIVVIPSVWPETFGMVVEEVLAAHIPVICTKIGGLTEHIFDGAQGRMFALGDVNGLAAIIQSILENPLLLLTWQQNIRRPRLCADFIADVDGLYRQLFSLAPAQKLPKITAKPQANSPVGSSVDVVVSNQDKAYQQWCLQHELTDVDMVLMAERMALDWSHYPIVHLFLVLRPGLENLLANTIDALAKQIYCGWRLSVIAELACPDSIFAEQDQLEWIQVEAGDGHSRDALNLALTTSNATWVTLIESGDCLSVDALFCCADTVNRSQQWHLLYCDEDRIDNNGQFYDPRFKPDFNLDLLLSMPYFGGLCLLLRESIVALGGYGGGDGAHNYDVAFKVLERFGGGAIGHISKVLLHRFATIDALLYVDNIIENQRQALLAHLQRTEQNCQVLPGYLLGSFQIDYAQTLKPKVSIIISTRDRLDLIKPCITSILDYTQYHNFEIIVVDNGSKQPDVIDYLRQLELDQRFRVLTYPRHFNCSAINNMAARAATGEFLLLLNDDTHIVHENWLELLLKHGLRKNVGIVGARLVKTDETLQHAGIILGLGDAADFLHVGLPMSAPGIMGRAQVVQDFSAVSGACFLIRKELYWQVGGMDEHRFKVLYGDIDLCLQVSQLGLAVVWTPFVTLVHFGGMTISQTDNAKTEKLRLAEGRTLLQRWLPRMLADPAYNSNLTLRSRNGSIDDWTDVHWDVKVHDRPRIMGLTTDPSTCSIWRMQLPLQMLRKKALIAMKYISHGAEKATTNRVPYVVDIARTQPDTLYLQAYMHDMHLQMMKLYKQHSSALLVTTLDDNFFSLPANNVQSKSIYRDIKKRVIKALAETDRLIVTTEPLETVYKNYCGDIRRVPNYLEKARWGNLQSLRQQGGGKPRVGWAGSMQHDGDLALMVPVIEATKDEIDWVFMGMYTNAMRPFIKEFHSRVGFAQYPEKLAALNLDLAIAPLEHHAFNEGKSNLRILEYGILGWPVVCSDVFPYRQGPLTRIPNIARTWIKTIRERINDLPALQREGDCLRQWVLQHWMLEDHTDEWLQALLSKNAYQILEQRLQQANAIASAKT